MKSFKSVDEYISSFDFEVQNNLNKIRNIVKNAAPEALESISYGMPVYKQNGVLVYFGAFKKHIGFFPAPSAIDFFKDKLTDYKTSKGTIQFPFNKTIPLNLIEEIVLFRVEENLHKAKTKK